MSGLKSELSLIDWDLRFVENDINALLPNLSHVILMAVDQHIPKSKAQNANEHTWIDHEFFKLIKVKNKVRTAVKKWKSDDQKKFRQIRREAKALIKIKKSTIPPKLENLFLITLNACGPSSNL